MGKRSISYNILFVYMNMFSMVCLTYLRGARCCECLPGSSDTVTAVVVYQIRQAWKRLLSSKQLIPKSGTSLHIDAKVFDNSLVFEREGVLSNSLLTLSHQKAVKGDLLQATLSQVPRHFAMIPAES